MTQTNAPVGWFPDPTGRYESRYFDGQWTQHVSTHGVNSVDPPFYLPSTAGRKRSPKVIGAIAGGAIVVAVGITLVVTLSGGSSEHGFCADAIALNNEYPSAGSISDMSQISHAAGEFDALAAESPSPQDAADLRYVARWLRSALTGDSITVQTHQAQAAAAAARFDAYATKKCTSNANR